MFELNVISKSQDENLWADVSYKIEHFPVSYSKCNIDFQIEYFRSHGYQIFDFSLILYNDGIVCGLFPLCLKFHNGQYSLDSFSKMLNEPLFINGVALKTKEKISTKIYELLQELKEIYRIKNLELRSSFNHRQITKLQRSFLNNGAIVGCDFEMCVDLSMTLEDIKARFRKSYKSLISQSLKLWNVEIFDYNNINEVEWLNFKELHHQVSGRKTRSDESWMMQLNDIRSKNSFYIALKNELNELVGGGYFLITKDEAYYGVAAYRRELFDKPLGHLVQYKAIQYCKQLNLKWYKIGDRPFRHIVPEISDKEISIADFKEGFSTDLFPIPIFTI